MTTEYNKVLDSNVSNPDNLICDNCINGDMLKKKLDALEEERLRDKEFAR